MQSIDASDGKELVVPPEWRSASQPPASSTTPREDFTREQMLAALQEAGGNVTAAAKALGCTRGKFYRRMEELGIERE